MIIITRSYKVDNPRGGGKLSVVTRRVFREDELVRVQEFLDERSKISGYEWYDIDFKYTKL